MALSNPIPAAAAPKIIREIVESGTWQLRHACGADAGFFLGWRAALSDEQRVDFTALDDASWDERVQKDMSLDASCHASGGRRRTALHLLRCRFRVRRNPVTTDRTV